MVICAGSPSTILISPSVSPYNSYTSASICLSVAIIRRWMDSCSCGVLAFDNCSSLVVAGEEDLAVLVEAVDQTFDGVGRVPHQGSAYRALGQCQPTDRALAIGLEQRPEVVLLQEPERGLARLPLVGLKRELGRALLQRRKRILLQRLVRVPVR